MSSNISPLNARAKHLRSLHKPADPIVFSNVYDGETARIVLSHGKAKALATSSYAVAAVRGKTDEELEPEMLISAARDIVGVIDKFQADKDASTDPIPLSVDMRDGWGEKLESVLAALIDVGVVGCNLEDEDGETGKLMPFDQAVDRVRRVVSEAKRLGVPDFALNARTDVLGHGGSIDDAIRRGQAFLEAGATSVFVWGGAKGRGVSREEVKRLVEAFDGRLNARLKTGPGYLTVAELSEIGVARISLGRELQDIAMAAYKKAVEEILG